MWEQTLLSRFGWGFRLFGRTIVVQTVVGLIALALIVPVSLLVPVFPAIGVFLSVVLSLLAGPWMYQVMIASFARSMQEDAMPSLVPCLQDGLARLPVMGNAMLLLMIVATPVMLVIGLLGMLHPLASLLGILVFMWIALHFFSLTAIVAMENIGPWEAVKRAWQLSDGFMLSMLGNVLFFFLCFLMLGFCFGFLVSMLGLTGLMQQLAVTVQSSPGMAADPMQLLMSLGTSALMGVGVFMLFGMLAELLLLAMMMAYSFFFYTEQKMAHDGGKPNWQPASMADRKQWMIYASVVGVVALVPTVAAALNPAPSVTMPAAVVTQQKQARVQPSPAARPAKPAVKAPARKPVKVAEDEQVPDSDMHRVKAPELDIATLRDPFESYLTVLEKKSKQQRDASRSRDSNRASEPLEDFDLGALKLVAIMKMGTKRAAMVENHEGRGYVVRKGSYIGRDNGRVVNITERNVEIMEDEFNVVGEIVQRKVVLTLNEVNQ